MHTDAITHAAQRESACGRAAQRQSRLHRIQADHVVECLRAGRDELLPKVHEHGAGRRVSEWLSNCDARQEALLFQLVHLALCRDNPAALYAVAQELATYVAEDYADAYLAFEEAA